MLKETDLGEFVISHLCGDGWDCYQEVAMKGRVADIVACRDRLIHVVELKTSFGLAVLSQAHFWSRRVHLASIAVPTVSRFGRDRGFGMQLCRDYGIGVFSVDGSGYVYQAVNPRLNRAADRNRREILDRLDPIQKTFAKAGNNQGLHWSPFKDTVLRLTRIVADQPGVPLSDAIRLLQHHYASDASARSSLKKWIEAGKIRGVRSEGRKCNLFHEVER